MPSKQIVNILQHNPSLTQVTYALPLRRPTTGTGMKNLMRYLKWLQHPLKLSPFSDLSEVNRLLNDPYKVTIYINFMQNENKTDDSLKTKAHI